MRAHLWVLIAAACNSGSDPGGGADGGGGGGDGDGSVAGETDGGGGDTCAATGWVADTVKSEDSVGWGSKVALDENGGVHITYANGTHAALEHAYLPAGGAWDFDTVDEDTSTGVLEEVSQVVAGGAVHVSYVGDDDAEKRLKHAVRVGDDDWDTEIVDLERTVGIATAIAVDGEGGLHIAYRDDDEEVVRHAWWSGEAWDSELVDEGPWTGIYLNIAVDGDDGLHLAYYDSTRTALRHAYRPAGGAWNAVTAAEEGSPGHRAALAVDADGGVHIASMAVAGGAYDVVYTHRAPGGDWTTVTVDAEGKAGYQNIAVDGGGGVHIAYRDETSGALKYAYRAPGDDDWYLEPVDEEGDMGLFPSIAIAPDGAAIISYVDRSPDGGGFAEDLKVARSTGCE